MQPSHAHRMPFGPHRVRTTHIEFPSPLHSRARATSLARTLPACASRSTSGSMRWKVPSTRATRAALDPSPRATRRAHTRLVRRIRAAHSPSSPRAMIRLLCSPRSEFTSWPASPDMSEHAEPIYYRPLPPPQASAPSRTRCAAGAPSASLIATALLLLQQQAASSVGSGCG